MILDRSRGIIRLNSLTSRALITEHCAILRSQLRLLINDCLESQVFAFAPSPSIFIDMPSNASNVTIAGNATVAHSITLEVTSTITIWTWTRTCCGEEEAKSGYLASRLMGERLSVLPVF
ncbi:hypothetical protein WG66_001652 [Moniliophthora roreri]|nr:hypothetical protein WG66_001652 [Moniliophthora roreri]